MLKLRLREYREARGWSLAHVGDLVGASAPHVSELERGVKRINNDWLEKFAEVYEVPVRELFHAPDDPAVLDALEIQIVCESLSPEDRSRLKDFAHALARSRRAGEQV
jgi:transcriptional regulator with XRE-family HTH domain